MTVLDYELEAINVLNSAMSGRYDATAANCRLRKLMQDCHKAGRESVELERKVVSGVEFSKKSASRVDGKIKAGRARVKEHQVMV